MATEYRFPIYRANEYNLRQQIMDALQQIGLWPVVQNSVSAGEIATVPTGCQLICYESFTVEAGGYLNLEGTLVVLGAKT